MLELTGIHAGYGRTMILQGVDLRLGEGECAGVLGRNGVGKTTLLRTIIGITPIAQGAITFEGTDITKAAIHQRARRGIAFVPQGRQIFPGLSVRDNLRVAAYGVGRADIERLLEEVLDDFPVLRDKIEASGGSLSGGQQQMLALARALMTDPKVLLLDEPSEGIQPTIVEHITAIVRRLNTERGMTVLLVEQNLEFATSVVEHAYILDKGRFVRDLSASEVLEDVDLQREYMGV